MPIFDNGRIFVLRFRKLFDEYGTSRKALADMSMTNVTKEDLANLIGWALGMLQSTSAVICFMEKAEKENAATDVGASITAG